MDDEPRRVVLLVRPDVGRAHRLEHFHRRHDHVFLHLLLIIAVDTVDAQRRNPPRIHQIRIDLDVVLVTGQHLAEAPEVHLPRSEIADQRFLELGAEARHLRAALPALPRRPSLESVAAQEIRMLRFHVAESRHIDGVGASSDFPTILRPRQRAHCAAIHDVVHHVVTELAACIPQPLREFSRR